MEAPVLVLAVEVEEVDPAADPLAVHLGALPRVAGVERRPQEQARDADVVETAGEGEVLGQALRALLASAADAGGGEALAQKADDRVGAVLEGARVPEEARRRSRARWWG